MGRTGRATTRALVVLLVNALVLLVLGDSGASAANSLGVKRNDYNRDGVSDLVGVYIHTGCLYRFDGLGNGSFGQGNFVSCGWESFSNLSAVGDMNGDGNGDLVGIGLTDGCIHRWKGNGSGGFSYANKYGCGWENYEELAGVGDITRDGIPDLVAVRRSDGCLARWKGSRAFGFTYIGDYGCGWQNYRNLEGAGDIDGNGVGDLVAIRRGDGCVASWLGNGNGGLDYSRDHLCHRSNSDWMIGMGDINRDGHGDVAGTNLVTTSILTWFSDGRGNFNQSTQHPCCFKDFILT